MSGKRQSRRNPLIAILSEIPELLEGYGHGESVPNQMSSARQCESEQQQSAENRAGGNHLGRNIDSAYFAM